MPIKAKTTVAPLNTKLSADGESATSGATSIEALGVVTTPSSEQIAIVAETEAAASLSSLSFPQEDGTRVTFPGKLGVSTLVGRVRPRVQHRLDDFCAGEEIAQLENLLIEGDNLQVMASLYRFRGQIDLIVADPPYNTGNDFRYNDKWDSDPNDPDPGQLVSADDGGKHSKWMRFMAPRLKMMQLMLKPGGVCAVCIDERELFRLGMLMDEIFYEHNRLGIINWQKAYSAKNGSKHLSTATEYVLIYAKDKDQANTSLLKRTDAMDDRYSSRDGDPDRWKGQDLSAPPHKNPEDYGIMSPFTGVIHYPSGNRRWALKRATIKTHLEAWGTSYVQLNDPKCTLPSLVLKGTSLQGGKLVASDKVIAESAAHAKKKREGIWPVIYFSEKKGGRPAMKVYLKDVKKGKIPLTFWVDEEENLVDESPLTVGSQSWSHSESGHSQIGINELTSIVGDKHNFQTVKPLKLISKIIHLWCPQNGIVLDPFAGSGTTGQAVLELNAISGTEARRRFIMIEQSRPEKGDAYARTLTADRLRRVISGDLVSGKRKPLSGGFTFKTSTTQVDREAVLAMQREEMVDLILMSHWDHRSRKGPLLRTLVHKDYKYLVARDEGDTGYFLVWDGPDNSSAISGATIAAIVAEAKSEGLRTPYHVYARMQLLAVPFVEWYKIPDEILKKVGFHESTAAEDL